MTEVAHGDRKKRIEEMFAENPEYKNSEIVNLIKERYNITVQPPQVAAVRKELFKSETPKADPIKGIMLVKAFLADHGDEAMSKIDAVTELFNEVGNVENFNKNLSTIDEILQAAKTLMPEEEKPQTKKKK